MKYFNSWLVKASDFIPKVSVGPITIELYLAIFLDNYG